MEAASNLLLAEHGDCAFVKIRAQATYNSSEHFKSLVSELRSRGVNRLILDLTECAIMDSTFLGVLASYGMGKQDEPNQGRSIPVGLVHPNERIRDSLANLDVLHLFTVSDETTSLPDDYQPVPSRPISPTPGQLARNSLEAHRTLMAANPANVAKFKEVTRYLDQNLKKRGKS